MSTSRGAGQTGARGLLSGTISNGATWYEDFQIVENGAAIVNADDLVWNLTIRDIGSGTATLTLTTDDSTLVVVQGASSTTLQIRASVDSLSSLEGDYICDLASKDEDGDDRIIHWAHGMVTFRDDPVWG